MPGLYGANTTSNVSIPAGNYSGLYSANGAVTAQRENYGNANVVSLLAVGTDGPNTVGNITSVGTITTTGNIIGGNISTGGAVSATGNVIGGNIVSAGQGNIDNIVTDAVQFDLAAAESVAQGLLYWNADDETLSIGLDNTVAASLGQSLYFRVQANTTITKGQVVQFSGVQGDKIKADPANAASTGFNSLYVIGLAAENITAGDTGFVINQGKLRDINTGSFAVGNILYLDPATPGGLTATEPTAPNAKVVVAAVLKTSPGMGGIYETRVTAYPRMRDIQDVETSAAATNDFLVYSGNVWQHVPLDISLDTTPTLGGNLAANAFSITGANNISASGNIDAGNLIISNAVVITGNIDAGNLNATLSVAGNVVATNSIVSRATGNANIDLTPSGIGDVRIIGSGAGLEVQSGNITGAVTGNGSLSISAFAPGGNTVQLSLIHANVANTYSIEAFLKPGSNFRILGGGLVLDPYTSNAPTNLLVPDGSLVVGYDIDVNTGNILVGNTGFIQTNSGNITTTSGYFVGDGGFLTNVSPTTLQGNMTGNISGQDLYGIGNLTFVETPAITSNAITVGVPGDPNANIISVNNSNVLISAGANASFQIEHKSGGNAILTLLGSGGNLQAANAQIPNLWTTTITGNGTISSTGNITSSANVQGSNLVASNAVTATGNITGSYFIGNGSQLTGLPAGYSNADVAAFLAAFGSNSITTTGNITAGNVTTYTRIQSNAVRADAAVASLQNTAGANLMEWGDYGTTQLVVKAQAFNMPSSTAGEFDIKPAGNVFLEPTGIVSVFPGTLGYIDNVIIGGTAAQDANFAVVSATGNITAQNFVTAGQVSTGTVSASGNVDSGGINTGSVVATADIDGANLRTTGQVSATGNITGNFFFGNASTMTGLPDTPAAGGNTYVQYNDGGPFGGNDQFTYDEVTNTLSIGNIDISSNIANVNMINTPIFFGAGGTPGVGAARIVLGNAYDGNTSADYDVYNRLRNSRFAIWDRLTRGDGGSTNAETTTALQIELAANLSASTNTRITSTQSILHIGGGSSAFQSQRVNPFTLTGHQGGVWIGNQGNVTVGNTVVGGAAGFQSVLNLAAGSNLVNSVNFLAQHSAAGNVTNVLTIAPFTQGNPSTAPTNYLVYYNPGVSSTYGINNDNDYRKADNYYAFYNEDDVAQARLGSLRRYHEFTYELANTGTVNIDKNNSQVQQIEPAGNVTIGDFQNFVTSASDSVNTDLQTDTVTITVIQGATGYDVTMPTGNAAIKYAGNVTTVGNTANSISLISVRAIDVGGSATYLVNISSEYV